MTRLKQKTHSFVIVGGCAVKENRRDGAVFYLAAPFKAALLDLARLFKDEGGDDELQQLLVRWFNEAGKTAVRPFAFAPSVPARSRPFLKIQDGCDKYCTYCAVPMARGGPVSLDKETALRRLSALEARGYPEAVLTGVSVSRWTHGGDDLAGLLFFLLERTSHIRLRLSSLEPDALDERLLAALSRPRIRPHFHLSVQSGSSRVLRLMGRGYTAASVEAVCAELRRIKDDPFLACDIIAGFPGETAADFEETYSLCRRVGFAWIHAFPFSPRPGTKAALMRPRVPEREAGARAALLNRLAVEGKAAYERRWTGRTVEGVALTSNEAAAVDVLTENYLKCRVPRNGGFADNKIRCIFASHSVF
jgi:threonylcarbamoyladenosine tRNA methylthiotransferase MtaB